MFKKMLMGCVAMGLFSLSGACLAEGKAKAEDAVALVKKAVAYLKKNGREKSLAAFNDRHGQFVAGELYVFVIDQQATMLAHGALPRIVGKNVLEMKDADGNFLFKSMLELSGAKGGGWVHYKWPNPSSKEVEAKSTYLEKVGELVLGCGIYQ